MSLKSTCAPFSSKVWKKQHVSKPFHLNKEIWDKNNNTDGMACLDDVEMPIRRRKY